jgi:hypothetical protein
MPTSTYDLIASNVLGSSAASVTFSSIPATYRDLVLVFTGTLSSLQDIELIPNATNSTGSRVFMYGDGSSTSSGTSSTLTCGYHGTNLGTTILQIFDYSATDKHKTMLFRSNDAGVGLSGQAQRWANTSAITSLELNPTGAVNFSSGCSFYLYGIVS